MEAEILSANHQRSILRQSLPATVPTLLISIGYIDPGKWAATVDGGARFGFDLVAFVLVFNLAAILCQYLSARIGVITGRDLAEICSNEYDAWTCMFLGVQAELSAIMLDLTMILGMAHGLNLLFGWDLFTCVFLTAADSVLFPLLTLLLENRKAKFLYICMAGFLFLSFIFGVLFSQPEIPLSLNGMLTKFSGESAFALMSLLGANIVPHNFYLHSYVVQWYRGPIDISKDALCHNHFWAILCAFSGIHLVNNVLMNAAANVFYSSGLLLLTFQDVLSLVEQVFRSPVTHFVFLLVLFLSNRITAISWSLGGQIVLNNLLKLDIPGWLHYATIRIIAVIPALYCVWSSGAEGMYQLLVFAQVLVALLLPSSVIPLFRVAGSRSIMGVHKASQLVEFLTLVIFIGMLGLNIIFVVEMIFGSSDWVYNLRWNMGNGMAGSYLVLLITSCASLCLMIWLAAIPLKSASVGLDAPINRQESSSIETRYQGEGSVQNQDPSPVVGMAMELCSDLSVTNFHCDLPEATKELHQELHLNPVESNTKFHNSPSCLPEGSALTKECEPVLTDEVSDTCDLGCKSVKFETTVPVGKTPDDEGEMHNGKDDDGDTWETEEPAKVSFTNNPPVTAEGPPSFRSLSGKSDEGGSGAGSLSRLAGLGRAARRQLAAILDEFWGQLYDFHGQATQEAKAKKLDNLPGINSKPANSLLKLDGSGKEYPEYLPSSGGIGLDTSINSSLNDTPKQPRVIGNLESSYGVLRAPSSSLRANHGQLLDAYVQSHNVLESGERRYFSVRNLPSSEAWDCQPATVHGYQIASYLNRVGRERSSDNGQTDSISSTAPSLDTLNYRNSVAFALGQKLKNGSTASHPPGFENVAVTRNGSLQSKRTIYDFGSSVPAENTSSVNSKKYHSLPDISGYSVPRREIYMSDQNSQWDGSLGYRTSAGRTSFEPSLLPSYGSPRAGGPLAFDEISPSKVYKDALTSQLSSTFDTGSLWSRQPFEQFGVADKSLKAVNEGDWSGQTLLAQENISSVDSEAKLLQSFRLCIAKLLKLEGSDWLFGQSDGVDEELIDCVAAREKFLYEAETREMNRVIHIGQSQYPSPDQKSGFGMRSNETTFLVSSVPNCGEGCIWRADLIVSFGVWCIHRILDLSLMESRPELWGKYTYVLNRLQGIIDPAFSRPRSSIMPCFCLQVPAVKSSPPVQNGMLPPAAKPARGKCTNASMLLDLIKDVEIAISCRKGRSGTAAGDVAFPKGKENLASVLKRYKRRLSNKTQTQEGAGMRKAVTSSS